MADKIKDAGDSGSPERVALDLVKMIDAYSENPRVQRNELYFLTLFQHARAVVYGQKAAEVVRER